MRQLYSDRAKKKEKPEAYIYDVFTPEFRNQLFCILKDVMDSFVYKGELVIWNTIHDSFAREAGEKKLGELDGRCLNYGRDNIEEYIGSATWEQLLDFIDFAFFYFDNKLREIAELYLKENGGKDSGVDDKLIDRAIEELNERFRQHNLGYEYANGGIIRIDNKVTHDKIVKPALRLICDGEFQGAEDEFMKALEKRRKRENKEAIVEAAKSFESTMKTICDKMNYAYNPNKDTAKRLIQILEDNGFYPKYMNAHLANVSAILESGLPTIRNKTAAHGQGSTVTDVPDELAEYAINLAAASIVMLVGIYHSKENASL